ncbi:MAG: hypothetical protein M3536_00990 [Actinomycetota bacterium]|nr:hypothetical protein [Actinomycetota bacterium]
MSTKIIEQSITSRTDPGELRATIERYKSNGWTVKYEDGGVATMIHPDLTGVQVTLLEGEVHL